MPQSTTSLANPAEVRKARKEVLDYFQAQEDRLTRHIERLSDRLIKEFEEQRRNKQSARALFRSTVSEKLQSAHCSETRDLRQWYNNVKEIAMKPREIKEGIRAKLQQHLATLRAPKNKAMTSIELDNWLTEWETQMETAVLYNLPEAVQDGPWYIDLANALATPLPDLATDLRRELYREGGDERSFRDIATEVRAASRALPASHQGRIGKGAFPSWNQGSQGEESTAHKRKKSALPTEQPRCRGCNSRLHRTEQCFYLFPEKAPPRFEAKEETRVRVDANLTADPSLAAEVQRLRAGKRSKPRRGTARNRAKESSGESS